MSRAVGHGLAAAPWEDDSPHAHVRRAAGFMAWSQTEPGHGCPISMTYAAVPALRADDALAKEWTPLLASRFYDPGLRPASTKLGALAGMGMTEKQGGSDVRANVTSARPTSAEGTYTLHGHKWFTSAPMNDVFLVLAQPPAASPASWCRGCSPTGRRNRLDVVRLKDKLGNRSNASSELELGRHRRPPARRRGPGRADDHRDGRRDPARLRARLDLADAARGHRGVVARRAPLGVRLAAHRQAADAERAGRPGRRGRGGDRPGRPPGRRRRPARRPARGGAAPDRAAAGEVLGLQAHPAMVAEALECLGGNGYVEESGCRCSTARRR